MSSAATIRRLDRIITRVPAEISACRHAERMLQVPVPGCNAHSASAKQHAASFNAASNRSRAERGEPFMTRDLFEASGIPEQAARDSGMMPPTHSEIIPPVIPR
jgi:hypothetical protein